MSAHTLILLAAAVLRGEIAQYKLWDILTTEEMVKVENFKKFAAWDYMRISLNPRWVRRVR